GGGGRGVGGGGGGGGGGGSRRWRRGGPPPRPGVCVSARAPRRAGGGGARRCRVRPTPVQQRMPNLSHDQGRRQPPGPEPAQHHWTKGRLVAELRLLARTSCGTSRSST